MQLRETDRHRETLSLDLTSYIFHISPVNLLQTKINVVLIRFWLIHITQKIYISCISFGISSIIYYVDHPDFKLKTLKCCTPAPLAFVIVDIFNTLLNACDTRWTRWTRTQTSIEFKSVWTPLDQLINKLWKIIFASTIYLILPYLFRWR